MQLIQYYAHRVSVGSVVMGAQTVSVTRSMDATAIVQKGLPTNVYNYYKKPTITVSVTNVISSTGGNLVLGGFNLENQIYNSTPDTRDIQIDIVGGGGLKFRDFVLKSATFNFPNQGNFTEQLTFEGHVVESSSSSSDFSGGSDTINVGRRQHYILGGSPTLPGQHLLNVEASINLNYGTVPTYGNFYTVKGKYISFPVDVSCTYEILDLGYSQSDSTYGVGDGGLTVNDTVSYGAISIGGPPSISLGDKCFLVNAERSGGDAGQNNYSIYKYTYRNNNNKFTVS